MKILNKLGVMQGRLLPKYEGRYQAHPLGHWQEEFSIARQLGLQYIEFIVDFNDISQNPLMSDEGVNELREIIAKSGVGVKTICADCFMEAPLHVTDLETAAKSEEFLTILIRNASKLNVTDIVIPCVDQSSLADSSAEDRFINSLLKFSNILDDTGINLSLETDLGPEAFRSLMKRLPSARFTINYDTGNSAALGFDIDEEFQKYGEWISHIHIKDRKLASGSVVLGTGDTNFEKVLRLADSIDYKGIFILQPYRDYEGVDIFASQLKWFKDFVNLNHSGI